MRFAVAGQWLGATHELNHPMTALLSYVRSAELMTEPLARADVRLAGYPAQAGEEAVEAPPCCGDCGSSIAARVHDSSRRPVAVCARMAEALQGRIRRSDVEFELRRREACRL